LQERIPLLRGERICGPERDRDCNRWSPPQRKGSQEQRKRRRVEKKRLGEREDGSDGEREKGKELKGIMILPCDERTRHVC